MSKDDWRPVNGPTSAGVERYTTDIIATDMKMLGSKSGSAGL